jgi:mRNA interferase RelE/StbE
VKYTLIYTQRAERDIASLDSKTKERIGETLLRYKEDPLRYAEKLSDPILGTYRFRIGGYRVIFDLEGNEIVVLRVGHRREIYRRR